MSKLTLCLIIFFNLHAAANVFSQTNISFNVKDANFKEVLDVIEKNTSYHFVFSEHNFPVSAKFNLNVKNEPVLQVLNTMLKNTGYGYKEMNDHLIVIIPANQQEITGKIVNENGLPLSGASVKIKGKNSAGVLTDVSGTFSIKASGDDILEIDYVGYKSQSVPVNGQTSITITLLPDNKDLNDVVVVGYGTQKKVNLTGAVSAIKGADVAWKPVGQISSALQGSMPGVTVTTSTGQPGLDKGTIRIRGVGTLNNNDALVLVDGVQFDDINSVDPSDIENISVLKDAAASAIYGVKAANGVILITTKRGKSGKAKVSYTDYFGKQDPARLAKFTGAKDYMQLANLMYTNSGSGAPFSDSQITAYDDLNRDRDTYADNDWLKMILTGSGFQQNHNLSIGGGSDNVKYHFSAGYFGQKGLIQNMDYDRITMRLNTDIKVSEKVNFSADIAANLGDRTEPQGDAGSAWYQFGQAAIINPTIVNKYSDGTWNIVRGGQNPIRLQQEGGLYRYKNNLFTGNFKGVYTPIKDLHFTGMASVNYNSAYNTLRDKSLDYYTDFPDNTNTLTVGQDQLTKTFGDYWFHNYQLLGDYSKTFGQHSIKLLVGFSRLSEHEDTLSGYRKNLASGELSELNAGQADGQTATGTASDYLLYSYFGRLNYSFKDRYLFEANLRRDGTSRFPDGQKWGMFPSFSAGWRISEENFMKRISFIENLKLRASWGELGNDAIGNYPYQSPYVSGSYPFGGTLTSTSGLQVYPNNGLTWETTKMFDAGIDAAILNGLEFSFDYYDKKTDNILLQLPIPEVVGLNPSYQNAGTVQNKGWEFNVNYSGTIGKEFHYNVGANISDVKNKILDIKQTDNIVKDGNTGMYSGNITGKPIGAFYGYVTEGIFQSAEQVSSHATQPFTGTGPGDLIYKDQNGDNTVKEGYVSNGGDMVYLGSNIPRYTYGFNLSGSYKGFDLGLVFQGVGKVSISTLEMERAPVSVDGNFKPAQLDSWTADNTDATFPKLVTDERNYQSSSYWVKSGAYLRLKSMQLGYTFPKQWLQKAGISKLRLYVSGQNLLTFTSLPGDIDPEAPNDSRYYPQVKTYTCGLNIDFN